jgi:hypothetical protein
LIIKKSLINIRTLFEQINPGEFTKIIDKAYIVCMFSHRERGRTPYIREHLLQWSSRDTRGYGVWQLMALG